MKRYLIYAVGSQQSDPTFTDTLNVYDYETSDDCFSVIVDIQEGKRYWDGEWRPVRVRQLK